MLHKELKKIIPEAETAVLFIHGIVGTPNHFKDFVSLVPENMSVCNILLEGHGKGVKDFSSASMQKWINQVDKTVEELLLSHRKIIIVAHSMGTLFAIRESIKNPEKIEKLILLATPLKLSLKPRMLINSLKVYFGNIKPDDYSALSAKNAYGIEEDRRFWRYFGWVPRYLELFSEIRNVRKLCCEISVPCFVYQSKNDEMVSLRTCEILKNNSNIHINILENSSHYYYEKEDFKRLLSETEQLFRN